MLVLIKMSDMGGGMTEAQEILKNNPLLVFFHDWVAKEECVRKEKSAVKFGAKTPGQNILIDLGNHNGDLYIYPDGDAEYVVMIDGEERSATLEQIKAAKQIMEEQVEGCDSFEFESIEDSEDGKLILQFTYEDAGLYRPFALVDLEGQRAEYFPDEPTMILICGAGERDLDIAF